jgi:predicted AlkP superfamily pyrophosphatase or phosphodiesterase
LRQGSRGFSQLAASICGSSTSLMYQSFQKVVVFFVYFSILHLSFLMANEGKKGGPYVYIISIDGMRTDYLWKCDNLGLKIPTVRSLIKTGVLAQGALSVMPTLTYPSHTSMLTGVVPNVHRIFSNALFVPQPDANVPNWFYDDINATDSHIVKLAHDAGLTTAGVFWSVTIGAPYDMYYPDAFGENVVDAKFLYAIVKNSVPKAIIPDYTVQILDDKMRKNLALSYIKTKVAQLNTYHFLDLDGAQHSWGVFSVNALNALERIDSYLGEILHQLDQMGTLNQSYIFIVSDHGFVNVSLEVHPGVMMARAGLTHTTIGNYTWRAWPYNAGGTLAIYINPLIAATNATLYSQTAKEIDQIVKQLLNNPSYGVRRAYYGSQLQATGGFDGAYVVLEAQPPYNFGSSINGNAPVITPSSEKGNHGYSPHKPEMFASFLVHGPKIKQNTTIGMVRLIDIAPTVAYILGLKMPSNVQGRILTEIFQ